MRPQPAGPGGTRVYEPGRGPPSALGPRARGGRFSRQPQQAATGTLNRNAPGPTAARRFVSGRAPPAVPIAYAGRRSAGTGPYQARATATPRP